MATIVDNVGIRLAARIVSERQVRGWSAGELARRAGVSRAMVAKIETNQSSPTAALLGRLSGAFGLTMSTLLARAEGSGGGRISRFADQEVWRDPASGYERRQVAPIAGSRLPLDIVEVSLPANASLAFPASTYAFIRQLIWMKAGRLIFVEGSQRHELSPGDILELGAPLDCTFENPDDEPCTYVVVVVSGDFSSAST